MEQNGIGGQFLAEYSWFEVRIFILQDWYPNQE